MVKVDVLHKEDADVQIGTRAVVPGVHVNYRN